VTAGWLDPQIAEVVAAFPRIDIADLAAARAIFAGGGSVNTMAP